jgi:hypothetical protein
MVQNLALLDVFLILGLGVGAIASGAFFITFIKRANLKSKVSHQILVLNLTIALMLLLSIAHGLGLFAENYILLSQGILIVFADSALIYQFVMLRDARKKADELFNAQMQQRREDGI